MTLGSLFDGSGGFPLAGAINGITPLWASEIEPYPIRVTKARFHNMKHLGSVLDVKGGEIEPVDIITFGSPCQDLSVAGKQKGIHEGERSSLFFEAVRIAKEMRAHDRATGRTGVDVRPRFLVWEHVPGAFSSSQGEDFRAVLEALGGIAQDGVSIPRPPKGKWEHAGCVVGDGWSIAWRLYDAQYWGVPQRRKRIYLVADLASERAGEILFEREGMCGYPAEGGEAREGIAGDAQGGAGGSDCAVGLDLYNFAASGDKAVTLNANSGASANHAGPTVCQAAGFKAGQSKAGGIGWQEGCAATLSAQCSGTEPTVCYSIEGYGTRESHKGDGYAQSDAMYTLNTIERHAVCYDITGTSSNSMKSTTPDSCFRERTVGRTLDTFVGSPECNQGGMVVVEAAGFSDAIGEKAQGGMGYTVNGSPSLRAGDVRAVVYDARGNGGGCTVPTLTGDHQNRVTDYTALCVGNGQMCNITMQEISNTLDCMHDQQAILMQGAHPRKYIVRRLTPLECCRLQGFPDWWEDGVEGSDSARYKMWGNGIALPCAADVMRRIAKVLKEEST